METSKDTSVMFDTTNKDASLIDNIRRIEQNLNNQTAMLTQEK